MGAAETRRRELSEIASVDAALRDCFERDLLRGLRF